MAEKIKEPWLYPTCMFCGAVLTGYACRFDNRFLCLDCAEKQVLVWIPDWIKKQEDTNV